MRRNLAFLMIMFFIQNAIVFSKLIETCQFLIKNDYKKCKIRSHSCVCSATKVEPVLTNSSLQILKNLSNNKNNLLLFNIYFKNRKPIIIDKKLPIFDQAFFNIPFTLRSFTFRFVKGFDVNFFDKPFIINSSLPLNFYDSSLSFFSNGRQLRTCLDFPTQPRSIFQMFKGFYLTTRFYHNKYKPLCPLAFANTQARISFEFFQLTSTFYRKNIPTFLDYSKNITNLNSDIYRLYFSGFGELTLTRRIINSHVFSNTKDVTFFIAITGIEQGLFKPLRNLKNIYFPMESWRKLAHKGIEWTYDLNSDIKVDLNDTALIQEYLKNGSSVNIGLTRASNNDIRTQIYRPPKAIPDKDFCIYAKFPFEQLVYWSFQEINHNVSQISCTQVWLIHPQIPRTDFQSLFKKYIDIFNKCDFNKRYVFKKNLVIINSI